jgi:hypothetical protein
LPPAAAVTLTDRRQGRCTAALCSLVFVFIIIIMPNEGISMMMMIQLTYSWIDQEVGEEGGRNESQQNDEE